MTPPRSVLTPKVFRWEQKLGWAQVTLSVPSTRGRLADVNARPALWQMARSYPDGKAIRTLAMPDEARLREQAREALQSGKLPARSPDRTWGGPGVGVACAVCERAVNKDETEFEVEFARDSDGGAVWLDTFHAHVRCFAAWEFERNKALQ